MDQKKAKEIQNFVKSLTELNFSEWDTAEYHPLHYYQFKTQTKRGLFVALFDEHANHNRAGDINLYVNPLSNLDNYCCADQLFKDIIWETLRSAGLRLVGSLIVGAKKGDFFPKYNIMYQSNPSPFMVGCDERSLFDKKDPHGKNPKKPVGKILDEIIYLRKMVLEADRIAESHSPGLEKLSREYPLITSPDISRCFNANLSNKYP